MLRYTDLFDEDKDLPERQEVVLRITDTACLGCYLLLQKSQNDALTPFQWKNPIVSLVSYSDLLLHKATQKQCALRYSSIQSVHLICCLNLCTTSLYYRRDRTDPAMVWSD